MMSTEEIQVIHWFILIIMLSSVSGPTGNEYRGNPDDSLIHSDHLLANG